MLKVKTMIRPNKSTPNSLFTFCFFLICFLAIGKASCDTRTFKRSFSNESQFTNWHEQFSASLNKSMLANESVSTNATDSKGSSRPPIAKQFQDDALSFVKDPFFYGLTVGLLVTPSLLKREDPELNEAWAKSKTADNLFELGDVMGRKVFHLAGTGILYGYGSLSHKNGIKSFASDLFQAHAISGVLVYSIQRITKRQRPDGTSFGFPSGHTSTSFTTASVIYRHYGTVAGISAGLFASYVGLSRLQEN